MIEKIKGWGVLVLSSLLVVLYALFQKRGQRINELEHEVTKEKLTNEMGAVTDAATRSQEEANEAKKSDEELRRRHADLLRRYDIE